MIVSPPKIVGTNTVAELFGVTPDRIRRRIVERQPQVCHGYLGKISDKHCWNLPELVAALFTSDASLELVVERLTSPPSDPTDTLLCTVPDCDQLEETVGLCAAHLRRLMCTYRRAPRSSLAVIQLVAMCRWVVERNDHYVLPADYDPWATVCLTPGCDGETNVVGRWGPLCGPCTARFWQNRLDRPRPHHWTTAA